MRNIFDKLRHMFIKNKKSILQAFVFIGFVVALVFMFVLIINLNIVTQTNEIIYSIDELDELDQNYDCILILGAGVRNDGSPTPMLRDRLIAGFEAHNHFKSIPILISGDSENYSYRETQTMKDFLLEKSVNQSNIICDGYGLSTYESIWRAKNIYGFNKILIVSQKYHLNRAIYIANKMGLDANGLDAALTTYAKQPYYSLREYFARVKDTLYSELYPNPKYCEIWREINE